MIDKIYRNRKLRIAFTSFVVIVLIFNFFSVQAFADEKVVEEIKSILNNYYIKDIPGEILNKDSVNEIINDLNDPYTQVMNQDNFNRSVNNTFFGIGVTIEMREIGAEVTSVMVNSPAMKAGISEGDIIIAVDESKIDGLSKEDALMTLNGKFGIYSSLKIVRRNKTLIINVAPDNVFYPTVYTKITNKNIGYISILSFGTNTLDEFEYKIDLPEMRAADSYILDLRNNPGGYIYSAIELAGYFSKSNPVAIFENKNGEKLNFKATEKKRTLDKPTAFLVNEYTASAAELLAAYVQDYDAAIIVGEKTYGKGVAQSTFKLSDGSIFKTTTLKLYSPKGRDISMGILPDVYIKNIDSLLAGELFSESKNSLMKATRIVRIAIKGNDYYINLDEVKNNYYLEAYRQIVGQATFLDVSSYFQLNENGKATTTNYPVIKYAEVPKTYYNVGDRVTFKFTAPNYNGLVQYRAMLWDEATNKYVDLWNTKDRYYDKWRPRGKDIFSITFPADKTGNYKIKVFVKRSGIPNSKGELKGMNSDSYVYEVPFKITN